ncbi:hypothetical protein PFISCL1PPCAC_16772, partial [Pristionchus fissidentatus]
SVSWQFRAVLSLRIGSSVNSSLLRPASQPLQHLQQRLWLSQHPSWPRSKWSRFPFRCRFLTTFLSLFPIPSRFLTRCPFPDPCPSTFPSPTPCPNPSLTTSRSPCPSPDRCPSRSRFPCPVPTRSPAPSLFPFPLLPFSLIDPTTFPLPLPCLSLLLCPNPSLNPSFFPSLQQLQLPSLLQLLHSSVSLPQLHLPIPSLLALLLPMDSPLELPLPTLSPLLLVLRPERLTRFLLSRPNHINRYRSFASIVC